MWNDSAVPILFILNKGLALKSIYKDALYSHEHNLQNAVSWMYHFENKVYKNMKVHSLWKM